jgi:hypothetical protein
VFFWAALKEQKVYKKMLRAGKIAEEFKRSDK